MSDLLRLFSFLLRPTPGRRSPRALVALVILAGFVSGIASTALVILIGNALGRAQSLDMKLVWGFLVVCVVLPLARFTSGSLLVRMAQGTVFELRMELSRRLLATPLRRLEEVGPPRLLAALTEDTTTIADVLTQVPLLSMQATVLVGCLVYLGWLSPLALLIVVGFLGFGLLCFRFAVKRAMVFFRRVREEWDQLFSHFRGLTDGTKELKLHRDRRQSFLSQLLEVSATKVRRDLTYGATIYAAANSWSQVLSFLLIALLFYLFASGRAFTAESMTKLVVVVLYMRTPLDAIMQLLPSFNRASVAIQKVNALGISLGDPEKPAENLPSAAQWKSLELAGITHTYRREKDDSDFVLGPISLAFKPGEMVFVVGGNGSGKTTLAKLILGLYRPEGGEVRLDGETVTAENAERYLELFSAVFSDFYLFDKLLGLDHELGTDARVQKYLEMLHLESKVRVEKGALSTLALSQGQRKRLALLTAYLEDRPIYLFDEWAADQDPQFKQIFYTGLLPDLRERGKTVIVITHDDRYYGLADRLIKLEDGSVVYDGAAASYPSLLPEPGKYPPAEPGALGL